MASPRIKMNAIHRAAPIAMNAEQDAEHTWRSDRVPALVNRRDSNSQLSESMGHAVKQMVRIVRAECLR